MTARLPRAFLVTLVLACAALAPGTSAGAAESGPAAAPPMGWNSWNAFGKQIDEQLIRDTADAMVESGMRDAGYEYLVVDGGWRAPMRDAMGNMQPDPEAFPSGIKALADYVHARGLKFGLHQAVDEDDCGNASPGTGSAPGATYAEKARHDAKLFASWGLDYLKFDWCGEPEGRPAGMSLREWKELTYGAMGDALQATGREIVYSISEYGLHEPWEWAREAGAHLWRTTWDIKPAWDLPGSGNRLPMGVVDIVDENAELASFAGPGGWNDPDMLEVGVSTPAYPELTETEARAHFSLWAIMAAPLMAAADLRAMPESTREVLTSREVIAIDQDPLGVQATRVRYGDDEEVWVKPLANGDRAVALFNRGERAATIRTDAQGIGMERSPAGYVLRDLWSGADTHTADTIGASVPAHGVTLLRVRPGTPDEAPPAAEVSLAVPDFLPPGEAREVTATVTNHGRIAIEDVRLRVELPAGWTAEPDSPASFTLAPGKSRSTAWSVSAAADAEPGPHELRGTATFAYGDDGRTATAEARTSVTVPPAPPQATAWLSDLDWISAQNQWGPVERDMSNGARAAGDGGPITLDGEVYEKGLGVHAHSEIRYYVGGGCSAFTAEVGVDDEVGERGSVAFEVRADGETLYESGPMAGPDPTKHVEVDITGRDVLELVVTGLEDTPNDHADWAAARVECGGGAG